MRLAAFFVLSFLMVMGLVWLIAPRLDPCCVHKDYPNTCQKWIREPTKWYESGWKWCPATGEVM